MYQQREITNSVRRALTLDGLQTFDAAFVDSTGSFLVGELEKLDPTLHKPLAIVTWGRDIQLRSDVSIADETSSFTNTKFAAAGGTSPNGKSWIGKDANSITNMQLDIGKTPKPLTLWGMQLGWTLPELASAQQLGRPIDSQKYEGMQLKYQMDIDEQVYIGDSTIGVTGMLNDAGVTPIAVLTGNWISGPATPDQIVGDINALLKSSWANTGYAVCPSELRLPPDQFAWIVSQKISSAGNISILEYIKANTICNSVNGRPLNVQPLKWLKDRGAGSVQRAMVYTNERNYIRYPLVPLQRTPLEWRGIHQLVTYYGRLGAVELVYPETVLYMDGI